MADRPLRRGDKVEYEPPGSGVRWSGVLLTSDPAADTLEVSGYPPHPERWTAPRADVRLRRSNI
ncbi:hypothetical protein ACFRCG_11565 [Embleya sp. NPDC056575]|uniref:hypothetical protein n=1 Tax=unclassified Embleya TaxID=2699296 RepID=UPI0036B7B846